LDSKKTETFTASPGLAEANLDKQLGRTWSLKESYGFCSHIKVHFTVSFKPIIKNTGQNI